MSTSAYIPDLYVDTFSNHAIINHKLCGTIIRINAWL